MEKSKEELELLLQDPRKRQRTTFSQSQLRILEDAFARQQYLVGSERVRLAALLNIGVPQVKVWFQNRRIRWRREQREMLMAQVQSQPYQMTSSSGINPSEESLMTKQFTNQQKLPNIDEPNI
ncbi:unnamed protein product [Cylicocyclus nassatus]|uniref:Homeobox domain-containing protein n=1 Tax=Cylicocyclus nassatus TaxID=53992 RepID=A0AA36MFI8_CYLNA|nr:unnamed protein product [Cylicocyclus nassatus]